MILASKPYLKWWMPVGRLGISSRVIVGLDLGSLFSKAVVIGEGGQSLSSAIIRSGAVYESAAREAVEAALGHLDSPLGKVNPLLVATGYGRARASFADFQMSEITCHAKGMVKLFPEVRTIIDIGGQDCKIIYVNNQGLVTDFIMNDKCAAGCGRFLEVMAGTLQVTLEEMGGISLKGSNEHEISSMCTVFAESEVISLVAGGRSAEDISAAIHRSIARRIAGFVARLGVRERVGLTGGVAKNIGMIRALEKKLGTTLLVPPEPQLTGAYGAALIGAERTARVGDKEYNAGRKGP